MFKPTQAHTQDISTNQYRLRIGQQVPQNAVNLAYMYTPSLNPEQNIQITDTSGFILENITSNETSHANMWPDDAGLLHKANEQPYLTSTNFLLSNVFKDGEPLYYIYEATYPVVDSKGPDEHGFYQGTTIKLVDQATQELGPTYKYQIVLIPMFEPKKYRVIVYTNFQTQPSDQIKLVYTAFKDQMTRPQFSETLNPYTAFKRQSELTDVLNEDNLPYYYQGSGPSLGESKIYVAKRPIRNTDHRTPQRIPYQITLEIVHDGGPTTITSPWFYDDVYHVNSLSDADEGYHNGHKRLQNKTASDIMLAYLTTDQLALVNHVDSATFYSVSTTANDATIYTQSDGNNYVLVETTVDTGTVTLPLAYRIEERPIAYTISLELNTEPFETMISIDDGIVEIGHDITEMVIVSDSDAVSIYQIDNTVYAFTTLSDIYYAPKYSIFLTDNDQIKLAEPVENHQLNNWYIRVKNGRFNRESISPTGLAIQMTYMIPEYFQQDFTEDLGIPYRQITGEKPEVIGNQKLKLRYKPLYIATDPDTNNLNVTVTVNGLETSIKGWDLSEGTIDIDAKVSSGDDILVNYIYQEHYFTYRGYWDSEQNRFWHLDLNLNPGHSYTFYNSETNEFEEVETFNLINKTVYIYSQPNAIYQTQQDAQEGTIVQAQLIRGSYRPSVLFHTFEELQNTDSVLIGKIQVRPNSSLGSLVLKDTRQRGGGLKEHIGKEIMNKIAPESKHYWDIAYWDGSPYSENGVTIIRLPEYILKEYGGTHTKEDVEDIVQRHIGFGILFIVEYVSEGQALLEKPKNAVATNQVSTTIDSSYFIGPWMVTKE